MEKILKIKFEIVITLFLIIMLIISITKIGIDSIEDYIFNIIVLVFIPITYYSIKLSRKILKEIWS